MLVGVQDVDVLGARGVRRAGDRTGERCVLDQRVDPENLARLEVQADLDGEACVAFETVVVFRHGGEL